MAIGLTFNHNNDSLSTAVDKHVVSPNDGQNGESADSSVLDMVPDESHELIRDLMRVEYVREADVINAIRHIVGQYDESHVAEGAVVADDAMHLLCEEGMLTKWQAKKILAGCACILRIDPNKNIVLTDKLACGGMGVTFKAVNTGSQDELVVKVPTKGDPDRFVREAVITTHLRRRNQSSFPVVHEHDRLAPETDDPNERPPGYYAMEFVDGKTLSDVVKEAGGGLDGESVIRMAYGIAVGLDAMHGEGVCHRDLKPDNVMISGSGMDISGDGKVSGAERSVILDLGIAGYDNGEIDEKLRRANVRGQLLTSGSINTTQQGILAGTVDYMSPEHMQGLANVKPPADMYALGRMLYFMVTGTTPFEDAKSGPDRIKALADRGMPSNIPGASKAVNSLYRRMIVSKPEDRITAKELLELMEKEFPGISLSSPLQTINRSRRRFAAGVAAVLGATFVGGTGLLIGSLGDKDKDNKPTVASAGDVDDEKAEAEEVKTWRPDYIEIKSNDDKRTEKIDLSENCIIIPTKTGHTYYVPFYLNDDGKIACRNILLGPDEGHYLFVEPSVGIKHRHGLDKPPELDSPIFKKDEKGKVVDIDYSESHNDPWIIQLISHVEELSEEEKVKSIVIPKKILGKRASDVINAFGGLGKIIREAEVSIGAEEKKARRVQGDGEIVCKDGKCYIVPSVER